MYQHCSCSYDCVSTSLSVCIDLSIYQSQTEVRRRSCTILWCVPLVYPRPCAVCTGGDVRPRPCGSDRKCRPTRRGAARANAAAHRSATNGHDGFVLFEKKLAKACWLAGCVADRKFQNNVLVDAEGCSTDYYHSYFM